MNPLKNHTVTNPSCQNCEIGVDKVVPLFAQFLKALKCLGTLRLQAHVFALRVDDGFEDADPCSRIGRTKNGCRRHKRDIKQPGDRFLHEHVDLAEDGAGFANRFELLIAQRDWQRGSFAHG